MDTWQKYAAELLGTFVLVFGGTTAIVASGLTGSPCSSSPRSRSASRSWRGSTRSARCRAVTSTPRSRSRCSSTDACRAPSSIRYWIAQFAGGILAAVVLAIATDRDTVAGTTTIPGEWGNGTAFLMELVFTAIFVSVILQASVSGQFGGSALLAIPLGLVAVHLAAIPFSGASVNPARTFGPALVGNEWDGIWIYFIAPPLGALLAVAVLEVRPRRGDPAADCADGGGPERAGHRPAP